jgi:4-amino-4-deoxy-L-arabinose transferase-like glycosyltransferase
VFRPVLSLLLLSTLTFLVGLGRPAITDADEAFYAEAAREMVESGDWLTPHFNYEQRFQKPILYYWLTAATYMVTGPNEWAARLWSALSGMGLTLLTWAIARPLDATRGETDAAWLAGAIVATSFGYFAEARMGLPDLPLAWCITLTIWAALRASLDPEQPAARTAWWVLAGVAAGLGFLMKGPVAIAVPAIVLLPVWWRESPRVVGLGRGLLVAVAVWAMLGLPWYAAMWAEHGTPYLRGFFVGDNLERFATARFNERRVPGNYIGVLLGGLLPWSAYLVALTAASLPRLRRVAMALTPIDWRLLIWAIAPLIFFTLSVGQQPRYILPVLPPLAVLLARAMTRQTASGSASLALRGATWATAALLLAMALVLARAQPILVSAYPFLTWLGVVVITLAGLAVAGVAAAGAWARLPAVLVPVAAALLLAVQFGVLAGRRPEPVEEMAALVRAHRVSAEPVAAYQTFVRNLLFYTRVPQVDLAVEQDAVAFVQSPSRVLLVVLEADRDRLQALSGVMLRTVAAVRYANTANIKVGTLLRPDPEQHLKTVLLVTNR